MDVEQRAEEFRADFDRLSAEIGKVIVGHRLRETVSVRYYDDEVLEWPLADVTRNVPSKN
ncbi:MAG: hypothetical protein IIB29_14200 [Chloroflexi bacterium]|nr:hypothetical protein [Chloroflexota bacterium]